MLRSRALLVIACFISMILVTPVASAAPTESLDAFPTRLPWTLAGAAAVSTGSTIYLIGGIRNGELSTAITRFDPATGALVDETVQLPGARYGASALWTGTEILIFGGATWTGDWNDTLHFNPVTKVLRYGTNMTSTRSFAPTVWTGHYAYLFGGAWGLDQIRYDALRYDPQTEAMVVVPNSRLPGFPRQITATWDGTRAIIFGGGDAAFSVMTFDPATETYSYLNATAFSRVVTGSSVQIGTYSYVFSGWQVGPGYVNRIQRLRVEPADSGTSTAVFAPPRGLTAAAAIGDRAYVFGGWNGTAYSNAIEVFHSAEGPNLLLWIGVAGLVAAVAIVGVAVWARRRRRAGKSKSEEKPPEGT
ncbi:MAG: hypothetical protein E6K10_02965 [Methanobacteriota archaeon]|nr:MAG: hypothetical protein E6K10_02965 [Euryarchaeota archaeon]